MDRLELSSLIEAAANRAGVPSDLYKKVIFNGENFAYKGDVPTSLANDKSGAFGVAQVLPEQFGKLVASGDLPPGSQITDPKMNLLAGAKILADGLRINNGNQAAAVAHYNAGTAAGKTVAAGQPAPAIETQNYLRRTGMDTQTTDPITLNRESTTSGTSDRTTTKIFGIDPAAVISEFSAKAGDSIKQLLAVIGAQSAFSDAAAGTLEQAGAATGAATTAAGEIDAQKNERLISAANAFNVLGPDGSIIAAHRQRQQAQAVMDQLRPKIQEESAVTPLDNPLRWMVNQFTVPKLVTAYNAAADTDKAMLQRISADTQAVQNYQALDTAPIGQLIRQKAASTATAQALELNAKADMLRGESRHIAAQGIMQMMGTDQTLASMWTQVAKMTADTYAQSSFDRQQAALSEKEAKQIKAIQPTLDKINFQQDAMGVSRLSPTDWLSLTGKDRDRLTMRAQHVSIGTSLGDTFLELSNAGALQNLAETNQPLYNFMAKVANSPTVKALQDASLKDPAFQKMPVDQQKAFLLDKADEKWRKEYDADVAMNGPGISKDNPMLLDLNQLILSDNPAIQTNPFVQTIAKLKSMNSMYKAADEDILKEAVGRAQGAPKDIPAIAASLESLYRDGSLDQYSRGAYKAGMVRPKGYGLSVQGNYTDASGVTRALQMWDRTAIERFLVQHLRGNWSTQQRPWLAQPDMPKLGVQ